MSRRSRGRNSPSRAARVERRTAERQYKAAPPPGAPTVMQIPDAIRDLTDQLNEEEGDRA